MKKSPKNNQKSLKAGMPGWRGKKRVARRIKRHRGGSWPGESDKQMRLGDSKVKIK